MTQPTDQRKTSRKLRAIIEIDPAGGEPTIYTVGETDMDRERILDYLRIFLEREDSASAAVRKA